MKIVYVLILALVFAFVAMNAGMTIQELAKEIGAATIKAR